MAENVFSSGRYFACSREMRFHMTRDVGRRASKMLREDEGSGYLAEKEREELVRHQR